jgi:hypothetical protein
LKLYFPGDVDEKRTVLEASHDRPKTRLFQFPPYEVSSNCKAINTRGNRHFHDTRHFPLLPRENPSGEPLNHEFHIEHHLCLSLFLRPEQHHQFMARARPTRRSCHSGSGWGLRGDIHAPIREVSEPGGWNHTGSFQLLQIPRQTTGPNPRETHDSGPMFSFFSFEF